MSLIITMSKCNIAFRGHRENDSYTDDDRPSSHGNFLEFVHLIAKYDSLLENSLQAVSMALFSATLNDTANTYFGLRAVAMLLSIMYHCDPR